MNKGCSPTRPYDYYYLEVHNTTDEHGTKATDTIRLCRGCALHCPLCSCFILTPLPYKPCPILTLSPNPSPLVRIFPIWSPPWSHSSTNAPPPLPPHRLIPVILPFFTTPSTLNIHPENSKGFNVKGWWTYFKRDIICWKTCLYNKILIYLIGLLLYVCEKYTSENILNLIKHFGLNQPGVHFLKATHVCYPLCWILSFFVVIVKTVVAKRIPSWYFVRNDGPASPNVWDMRNPLTSIFRNRGRIALPIQMQTQWLKAQISWPKHYHYCLH